MTFKIFKRLSKISIMEIMSYRTTTIILFFVMTLFFLFEILSGIVFFNYTDNIANFTKWDYFNLIITSNIILMLHNTLFIKGIEKIYNSIPYGMLDHIFTKPINSFWFIIFNGIDLQSLISLILYSFIQVYILAKQNINLFNIIIYIIFILLGAWYLCVFNHIIANITFYTDRASALMGVSELLDSVGQRPKGIYPKKIKLFLTFILSHLVVYNAPIELLKGNSNYYNLIIYIITIIILTIILYKLWFISIKKYQSAN